MVAERTLIARFTIFVLTSVPLATMDDTFTGKGGKPEVFSGSAADWQDWSWIFIGWLDRKNEAMVTNMVEV